MTRTPARTPQLRIAGLEEALRSRSGDAALSPASLRALNATAAGGSGVLPGRDAASIARREAAVQAREAAVEQRAYIVAREWETVEALEADLAAGVLSGEDGARRLQVGVALGFGCVLECDARLVLECDAVRSAWRSIRDVCAFYFGCVLIARRMCIGCVLEWLRLAMRIAMGVPMRACVRGSCRYRGPCLLACIIGRHASTVLACVMRRHSDVLSHRWPL